MFIIADEDIPVVMETVSDILNTVASGAKRADTEVDIGDGICPIVVTGYWVNDVLRLDIKIKK